MVRTKRGVEDSDWLCMMLDSMEQLYKPSEASSANDGCQEALSTTIYTSFQTQIEIEHCYPTRFLTHKKPKQAIV